MARNSDWEAIENDYRLGQLTVRQIADKHGVNKSSITTKAKKLGWSRDLSAQVKAATRAGLVRDAADKAVQNTDSAIATAAQTNISIVMSHRQDIAMLRGMIGDMVKKIRAMGILEDGDIDLMAALQEGGAITETQVTLALKRIRETCSTGSQVAALKNLSDTLTKLIALEREAFGIDDAGGGGKPPVDPDTLPPVAAVLAILQ